MYLGDPGLYGDYVKAKVGDIPAVKEQLLEQMITMIRELSKRDDFFIIKTMKDFEEAPMAEVFGPAIQLAEDEVTVGWKILIPQMSE